MAPKKSSKPKVDDAAISEKDREAAVTSRRLQEAALHAGVSAENPNLPHPPHASQAQFLAHSCYSTAPNGTTSPPSSLILLMSIYIRSQPTLDRTVCPYNAS